MHPIIHCLGVWHSFTGRPVQNLMSSGILFGRPLDLLPFTCRLRTDVPVQRFCAVTLWQKNCRFHHWIKCHKAL